MLSTNDHKNKDIMKLVNPSIFDYFQAKNDLSVNNSLKYINNLGLGNSLLEISIQLHSQVL